MTPGEHSVYDLIGTYNYTYNVVQCNGIECNKYGKLTMQFRSLLHGGLTPRGQYCTYLASLFPVQNVYCIIVA